VRKGDREFEREREREREKRKREEKREKEERERHTGEHTGLTTDQAKRSNAETKSSRPYPKQASNTSPILKPKP
jgi:hypothetical protein